MTQGQIVKCINGGGVLKEGQKYIVGSITENGNYRLWDEDPPEPCTSFHRSRFEDTGENIFNITWSEENHEYYIEDSMEDQN